MNAIFQAAVEVQRFMDDRGWKFCIIGGLAVVRWGQARATQDVDISLFTNFGTEDEYIDALLDAFAPRVTHAQQFALANRVVLLTASNGIPLDVALAAFPYEEQVISRSSPFEFAPGVRIVTASAEDLVVLKAFAGREQDWADVRGIAAREGSRLDWEYVLQNLEPLCALKDDTAALSTLEAIRDAACK